MKRFWLLLPLILVSACVGTSMPSKFYTLQSENSGIYVNNRFRSEVGIREVTVPDYLDKPQIVTLKANSVELNISELNRWSEPLTSMLQRIIAADLGYSLPKAVVKPRTSARENFKYLVQVEINKFDGIWNKSAELEAWWSVTNADGKTLIQKKTSLSANLGEGYDALVKAQSRLIAELSAQIAAGIAGL